ncbi:unnamed protein product [Nezara viridula]|uniref:Medium-chain acyl-CoA ligase ACSF2, mitochondrial n=1 Tax=Nezara viridula TaxID=85310 RepID=A0A9P0MSD5_NEZVI|nr:unnamed protein product [Nezara viridula]
MGVLRRTQALLIWNIKRCLSGDIKKRPAYYHNPGTERLRAITTGQLINLAAEKWPKRNAIISLHEKKQLTFMQLKEQADQLGAGFVKLGLKPGDRLAVIGANTIHWYVTMQAAAKAGLILVMLNPAYRPLELSYALKHVGVKGVVTDHKFKTQNYPEILAEVAPGISKAPHGEPLNCPELPDLSFVIVATDEKLPGCYRYDDIMVSPQEKEIIFEVENQVQPDDPTCIQFSSGTTGQPKAAVLSHFGTINNGHFFGKRCGYDTMHHTLCLQVPMFHIMGSTLGILCALDFGMTLVLPGPSYKKEDTIKALEKHKCNVLYGTPTMHIDICNDLKKLFPEFPKLREACKDFKVVVSGGAICTPSLFKDIYNIFECKVQSAYGLTETSPICFTNTQNDTFEQRTTTVGFVADHLEVKIVDKEGRMVNFGESGEVWFRSFGNLLEYWGDEKKTKEAITSSNWFKIWV